MIASGQRWAIDTPVSALSQPEAVVVLKMGMAVNALYVSQQLGLLSARHLQPGPQRQLNVILGLNFRLAFLKEAAKTAAHHQEVILKFAQEGGARPESVTRLRHLIDFADPLTPVIRRVRDQVTFHWDTKALREWIAEPRVGESVRWIRGVGPQSDFNFAHQAAVDVLTDRLVPHVSGDAAGESARMRLIDALIEDSDDAVRAVIHVFEKAAVAFLQSVGGTFQLVDSFE